jgi:hypothetical protein
MLSSSSTIRTRTKTGRPMNAYHKCRHLWLCCPSWIHVLLLFVMGNIIGDLIAFPFVHSFWNLVGFEGWFMDD